MDKISTSFLKILLPLALALLPLSARAATEDEFAAANDLYAKEDFSGALSGYEALAKSGYSSANLLFNTGNAQYRLGHKGAAFLAWERALALDPAHPEAAANLRLLREETGARVAAETWATRLLAWPPGNDATGLAVAAFWVLAFSLLPIFFKRRVRWVLVIFSALGLSWGVGVLAWRHSQGELWIAIAPQTPARVAPAENSELAGNLPMGSHLRLIYERGPWLYVQLPDGVQAWISQASAERVTPDSSSR